MGLNVSTSVVDYNLFFENKDMLKNNAKNILNKSGATSETTQKVIEKTLFENNSQLRESYSNSQLAILKASTQISLNSSLKETLKYLKEHTNKKIQKKHVLGELWKIFSTNNESTNEKQYQGELYEFNIDYEAKNIFAA